MLRNHGLINRDTVKICGYNSRLDTFQAVVGNWLLPKAKAIANQRIINAKYYDKNLGNLKEITIPPRPKNFKIVFHLYIVFAKKRDQLLNYCKKKGIEAKIHYPLPMYIQESLKFLKHKKGDFPIAETIADSTISLPVHEFISRDQQDYVIKLIKDFYD